MYRKIIVSIIILFPVAVLSSCDFGRRQPVAVNGFLDISSWDLHEDGIVKLNGEWEFYWEKLLRPEDFIKKSSPRKTGFIKLPNIWNGYEVDGKTLSGDGYATFRIIVDVGKSTDTLAVKNDRFVNRL